MKTSILILTLLTFAASAPALAQRGTVAAQCAPDIQAYCPDAGHGARQTRTCLEKNRDKLTAECRQALDSTGPGRGRGRSQ